MPNPQSSSTDTALARAVVYRMMSVGFQPPTAPRLEQIGASDGFRTVVAALQRLDPEASGLASAATHLAMLTVPSEDSLAASFWRLFGHTTRGLICACETEYGPDNGFHQPQQLADIAGYYLAFGLRPVVATDTRADHIACECEFMDFLSRKEAHLLERADAGADISETLEVTRMAARSFLREHLGRFGRAYAARVAAEDGDGYFGALGRVLLAFVDAECARVGVDAGPVDLPVRPDEPDETPMACGTADDLIQIQRHP
jgi:putative dimethyl sulfoxide reductase chaperone